jgi:hypothetical protein
MAILLAACSARTEAETPAACASSPTEADAGPTYVRAFSASYAGALGTLNVICDGTDPVLSGDCVANGGQVTVSAKQGASAWHCEAAPDVPAKGELLIGWATCLGVAPDGG